MPNADRTPRRSKPFRILLWTALGAAALGYSHIAAFGRDHALMINASPSLPYWAIWLNRTATPDRGDIILFDPPPSPLLRAHFGEKPQAFGKEVYGIGGDHVTRKNRDFFVNGKFVARAKTQSRKGESLRLGPTGTIPHGCYFVGTAHKDGFDSRYGAIGWICRNRVLGVGRAIL